MFPDDSRIHAFFFESAFMVPEYPRWLVWSWGDWNWNDFQWWGEENARSHNKGKRHLAAGKLKKAPESWEPPTEWLLDDHIFFLDET